VVCKGQVLTLSPFFKGLRSRSRYRAAPSNTGSWKATKVSSGFVSMYCSGNYVLCIKETWKLKREIRPAVKDKKLE
jgi:hypothetical protein